ncbi:TIGR00266 family protein [Yinghuangia sp. YIM S09857]|uniref:TIGR00266 family protein n=1 Tax=Yinghuangia sp. YIM S09857 TaxID=3436929 RepID=UPI003F52FD8E
MKVQLRHNPSFTVARCVLAGGEQMRAESGAMLAHSAGVSIDAKIEGGLMRGLKRSVLGGESLYQTTFTAPPQGGWVDVAANLPGDAITIDLEPGQDRFLLTKGCWLANSSGVTIDTKWGGARNLFGGEGGFLVEASGQGVVVASCFGALDVIDLEPGEQVVVDTGHVVAYAPTITFQIRRAVQGRSIQSMKSGEGFVFDFTGPGRVLAQSRNPSGLISYLTANLPGSRA